MEARRARPSPRQAPTSENRAGTPTLTAQRQGRGLSPKGGSTFSAGLGNPSGSGGGARRPRSGAATALPVELAGFYSLEPEEGDERQLLEQLKDRVRDLNVQLEESDVRQQRAALEAEGSLRLVRLEAGVKVERYRGERDKLQERLEVLRRKFSELDKDDYDQIKERLEKLVVVSRDGWEQVAVKNVKLQKLRQQIEGLLSQVGVERAAKEAAEQIRDKALAKLKPFKEKNLGMEHRLSLQHNLYSGAANESRQIGNELIRLQRSYADLSERATRAIKAGRDAGNETSKTHVEFDRLAEDFETLQARSVLALGAREDLEKQVFEQSEENSQLFDDNRDLRLQLADATKRNEELEANLAANLATNLATRADFSACQKALENESDARLMLEARASSLEHELAVLREVLHAPMLSGSNVHTTLKQRFGSIKTRVHHAFDSPVAVSVSRPATSMGLPPPGRSRTVASCKLETAV